MAYDRPYAPRRYTAGKSPKTVRFGEASSTSGRATGSEQIFKALESAQTLNRTLATQAMWMAEVAPGIREELPIISGGCIVSPDDLVEE